MLGLSMFALTLLLAAPARGEAEQRIDWRVPPNCPTHADVQGQLTAQVEQSHASAIITSTPWQAMAQVTRSAGGYVLSSRIDWPGHRWQRQLEAQTCEELAAAFILLLVSELEAGAGLTPVPASPQINESSSAVPVPPPLKTEPAPPVATQRRPPSGSSTAKTISEQPQKNTSPDRPTEKARRSTRRKSADQRRNRARRATPNLGLQLGLGPTLGVLPNITAELRLGLHLRWRHFSLLAGGRASAPTRWQSDTRDGISALFGHSSFDLGFCLNLANHRRWSVPVCATSHLGMIWARAQGLGSGGLGTVAGLSLELAGEIGPSLRIRPNLRLSWLFSAAWQAVAGRYYIEGLRDQYTPERWSLRSALVLDFQLWPRPNGRPRDSSAQLRQPSPFVVRAPRPQRADR